MFDILDTVGIINTTLMNIYLFSLKVSKNLPCFLSVEREHCLAAALLTIFTTSAVGIALGDETPIYSYTFVVQEILQP